MSEDDPENDNFGRYYERFEIGDSVEHYPGKTITESDNNLFSLLTMNHHPVHLDQNYAQNQQHGEILVVGTLVFSVVVGMSVSDISGKAIANLGYEEVTHENPVFIGDTVHAETVILDKRVSNSNPDQGIVHVRTKAYNQDNKLILTFERSILVPKEDNNNDE